MELEQKVPILFLVLLHQKVVVVVLKEVLPLVNLEEMEVRAAVV